MRIHRSEAMAMSLGIRLRRKPEDAFSLEIGIDVAFEFNGLNFGLNLDRFSGIHKFIREEVMPRFVRYFPQR